MAAFINTLQFNGKDDLLGELCYDRFMYAFFPSALSGKLTKAMKKIDPKYTNYDLYKGLDNKTSVITRDVAELAGKLRKNTALTKDILSGMRYDAVIANYPGAFRSAPWPPAPRCLLLYSSVTLPTNTI